MVNRRLGTVALLAFFASAPLFAAAGPLAFSVDEETQSYTITEQGRPVLTYRFGEVPLPAVGVKAPDFTTVMMFESKATPLFPNNFRYYGSTCISLAFPGRTILPLAKGKPLDYSCPSQKLRPRYLVRTYVSWEDRHLTSG